MDVSAAEVAARLEATGLFPDLSPAQLHMLAVGAEVRALYTGQVFLREGEAGDALYVVHSGAVEVFHDRLEGTVLLARLGETGYLGEQALLPGGTGRRNASARAAEPTVLIEVPPSTFRRVLARHPALASSLREAGLHRLHAQLAEHGALFAALSAETDFEDAVHERAFPPGATLVREGAPADALYLILDGIATVHRRDGADHYQVGELGPGDSVGELGLAYTRPRGATVTARTPLKVLQVDGAWFKARLTSSPHLQAWMSTLEGAYELPHRGLLTRHSGHVQGRDALTSVYHFPNGREVTVTQLVGDPVVNVQQAGASDATEAVWTHGDLERSLRLVDGRLVGLTAVGPWPELPEWMARLLDEAEVTEAEVLAFEVGGAADSLAMAQSQTLICPCLQVSRAELQRAIDGGCDTLQALSGRTACGLVCGGCVPALEALLEGR